MCRGAAVPSVAGMTCFQGSVTAELPATADDVFGLLVDVGRLPEWNAQLPHVVAPGGPLRVGSEWVVVQCGLGPGIRWSSRATVLELDRAAGRFGYRSGSDGPNTSFATWTWTVTPIADGARVTVGWQLHPKTFWRRTVGARVRHRQLRDEVGASLQRMAGVLTR
jgi:hypothetical protein